MIRFSFFLNYFQKIISFVVLLCINSQMGATPSANLLTKADIQKVMGDLFSQHVSQKEISPALFKQASLNFIEQFDAEHLYLLNSEVDALIHVDENQALALLNQYKNKDYSYFVRMSDLFRAAILRSRKIRDGQEAKYASWIQDVIQEGGSFSTSWPDWAKSPDELSERQESLFKAFVATKARKFGRARVLEEKKETVAQFKNFLDLREDPYLYLKENGESLGENEQQNLFSLKVLKALAAALDAHTKIYDPAEAMQVKNRLETDGGVAVSTIKYGNGIIGVIKLDAFFQAPGGQTSEWEVKKAIEELEKKNLRGLILDLRDNTGGFLNQAVKVAGLFMTSGVVVISKYSSGEERFYRDMDGKTTYQGPLIVLVSKMTASAAEIVAGALKDYGLALIVGDEHTYGKGTIQTQTVTQNQKDSSYFKVTVGTYYTPSGGTPQIKGIIADITVPGPREYQKIGEAYLTGSLKEQTIPSVLKNQLEGVSDDEKEWYLKYYMPKIQNEDPTMRAYLPELIEKSQYRLKNNKNYQAFIKNPEYDEHNGADLQLKEGLEIMKDIIYLESKSRPAKQ